MAAFGLGSDTARLLTAFRALGCDSCQFYREEGFEIEPAAARRLAEKVGLPFDSIHGLFGEHIDPSSSDPSERTRCLGLYEEEGRLALDLGGWGVVVHPACFTPGRRMLSTEEAEAAQDARWGALSDFLARLAEIGERLGVVYLIENQPRNCPLGHRPGLLADRIRAVGSSTIRMCFDTGHAHMTGDVAESLRACADVIAYLHVHDNDGAADQHLIPGGGTIPWRTERGVAAVLRSHHIHAPCMLEVFEEPDRIEALALGHYRRQLHELLALERTP